MFSIWSVSLLALLYLALLFIIAWWADKYKPKRFRALFYSLTLGVYSTSCVVVLCPASIWLP